MAVAGRVLIMPKGAYDESITYEMLDMVSHNNQTWLAKKTCVGVEPSADNEEYWFNMVGISATELETLKEEILAEVNKKITTEDLNDVLADYLKKSGGNMTGTLAVVNPSADVEGVRNIKAGTSDLEAGTSPLTTGSIYIVYE